MRSRLSAPLALLSTVLSLTSVAQGAREIFSNSLNTCQVNSQFSATLFNVVFRPDEGTLDIDMEGVSLISGNVTIKLEVLAYGYKALDRELDPCDSEELKGLCPWNTGQVPLNTTFPVGDVSNQVPGIAYTIPDLDGVVRVYMIDKDDGAQLACVEAELSNGKTVYQKGVGWATAVIAGLGLIASAITNGLGHSNTAAHVAANAMSLFGYFQSQALIGMTAVDMPPVVRSWTQNFQWSMGIIHVGFLQEMATWYQRATGGTPSSLLSSLSNTSVQVMKRSVEFADKVARAVAPALKPRSNAEITNAATATNTVVRGIERVGFRARIEPTNIFLTGYAFFVIFVLLVVLGVVAFKYICEGLAKTGKMKADQFHDFRTGWTTVLKGIMYRIILIGFPQMTVLCFWELTKRDSAAEVVLAIFTIVAMMGILGWASLKVIMIAKRSISMHKNPAYILYSDPVSLNKWGFLYVQFKATAYYFIVPVLAYILIKGLFVGLGQGSGVVQAVGLLIIEAAMLITVSIILPYMDKKTNGFNIAIAAISFTNAVFLLFFSNVFNQPAIVTGVIGVVFFIANAIFSFVLLIMVLVSSIYALASKNPDTRYQPMRDDRGSFIKSQTQLNTELDALGATARGEPKAGFYGNNGRTGIDDDDDSFSSSDGARAKEAMTSQQSITPPAVNAQPPSYHERSNNASPNPYGGLGYNTQSFSRPGSMRSDRARQANNSSPWQRGAGYDH